MPSDTYTLIISDASTAALHASTHGVGAADAISISATQVTAGTLPVLRGGSGVTTATGSGSIVLSTSPTLVTPVLGTPAAGSILTNCTGLPLATGVTGTLSVANGGTGVTASTGSGSNVLSTSPTISSPILVTPALGTPASGTLTNCTGLPISGLTASVATALGVGSIELGNATDTTISRVSAGRIAVEGVNVVTTSSTDTLTNKTLTLTSCTGLPLTTGVTGILPVANGGTGTTTGVPAEIDTFTFDTTPASGTGALTAGQLRWNATDKTLDLKLDGDVTLQVGQESNLYCYNAETTTITDGTVVYIYGADGTIPAVKRATNTDVTSDKVLGVATQDISTGGRGYITTHGLVRDLDTTALGASGTPLYLATAGALTSTKPSFPAGVVRIGTVVVSDTTEGSVYVQPQIFQDGRTSGQFTWVGNVTTGPTITVAGLTSSSNVIIQQRGSATILTRHFGTVCSAGSFIPYADAGTALDTKLFSYIAFI
jgi:hypothetical protein